MLSMRTIKITKEALKKVIQSCESERQEVLEEIKDLETRLKTKRNRVAKLQDRMMRIAESIREIKDQKENQSVGIVAEQKSKNVSYPIKSDVSSYLIKKKNDGSHDIEIVINGVIYVGEVFHAIDNHKLYVCLRIFNDSIHTHYLVKTDQEANMQKYAYFKDIHDLEDYIKTGFVSVMVQGETICTHLYEEQFMKNRSL